MMVKMRFGTDELGTDETGTEGLVNLRLVKPSCASKEVLPDQVKLRLMLRLSWAVTKIQLT